MLFGILLVPFMNLPHQLASMLATVVILGDFLGAVQRFPMTVFSATFWTVDFTLAFFVGYYDAGALEPWRTVRVSEQVRYGP